MGQMHSGWLDTLVEQVPNIPVPGEAQSWNCQDYVLEIWDFMLQVGMIDQVTWTQGKEVLMPYFGQDFGGEAEDEEIGAGEEDEEEEADEEGQRQVLSEEFVYDSSE